MKTITIIKISAAIAVALALLLPVNAKADVKKGAEGLMRPPHSASTSYEATEMKCPKCQTVSFLYRDGERGAIKYNKVGQRHLCTNCKTEIQTLGTGKASTRQVVHTCQKCGATLINCCDGKSAAVAN